MSRPLAINPRSEAVRVRLNRDEKRALLKFAETLDERPSRVMRRLIREAVTGGPDYFQDGLAEIRETHRQLAAIGRNLNQLTKLAHKGEALLRADIGPELEAATKASRLATERYQKAVRRVRSRRIEIEEGA